MGWGRYWLSTQNRAGGYLIEAECDAEGCSTRIDRGLGYLCGTMPESTHEDGCGLYHCAEHYPAEAHACRWAYPVPCECDVCGCEKGVDPDEAVVQPTCPLCSHGDHRAREWSAS